MPNILPPSKLDFDYLATLHTNKKYNLHEPKIVSVKRFEQVQVSTDQKVIRLQDKQQLDIVSLVVTEDAEYSGNIFQEVKWTHSAFPRKKYLSYLFEFIIYELGIDILSDKNHTSPGSKEFWLSLGRKKNIDLYIYNVKTNYKRKYKNYPEEKIWGLSNNYLDEIIKLLAEFPSIDGFETDSIIEDEYSLLETAIEIEQEDDIDSNLEFNLDELDNSATSKEIYDYVIKYKKTIESLENIRLIAQKTT